MCEKTKEITPAMIDAGVSVLVAWDRNEFPSSSFRILAEHVYRAMSSKEMEGKHP